MFFLMKLTNSRVIVISESFGKWIVVYFQLRYLFKIKICIYLHQTAPISQEPNKVQTT